LETKSLLSGEDKSPQAHVVRALLTPLALLHAVGLELYLLPYRMGLRKRYRLPVPVIAIGNLTSGGTGKTPMAAAIGQLLRDHGVRVVLLSRGHGGSHEKSGGAQLVSRGDGALLLPPEVAGDEPTLLAQLLPDVPVLVGRDRRVSGQRACAELAPDLILLDDALQFWQLHRDLDIVLLDARQPFDNGWLLPRGLLREPPAHLHRAGMIVLTRADRVSAKQLEATRRRVAQLAPGVPLFTATHAPQAWVQASTQALFPLDTLVGKEVGGFAGIADGAAFAHTLQQLGLSLKIFREFGDHHTYNKNDILSLIEQSPQMPFVTTEKDLTKVLALWPEGGPELWALRIGIVFDDPKGVGLLVEKIYGRT